MKNNIILLIAFALLLIPSVFALEDLKPAELNKQYTILQTCASCTYVNITVSNSDGLILTNKAMINNGSGTWTYNFTPTKISRYDVTGVGDMNGVNEPFAARFEVTPSGFLDTFKFYLLILLIISGVITLGFILKEEWFIVLGGMGLMMLGIYTINSGFVGFKDMFMTWGMGIFEIGVGFVLTIIAGLSKMDIEIF
jgi:hypothetical protein